MHVRLLIIYITERRTLALQIYFYIFHGDDFTQNLLGCIYWRWFFVCWWFSRLLTYNI